MSTDKHKTGVSTELYVAHLLAEKGYGVYFPFLTQSRHDLVVSFDNLFFKVQVKTATWSKTGPYQYLQCRLVSRNKYRRAYTEDDVDIFVFVDDTKRVWMCSFDDLKGLTSVCLDSTNPKYRPKKKYDSNKWRIT